VELKEPNPSDVNDTVPDGDTPVTETDTVDDPPTVTDDGLSDTVVVVVACVTVMALLLRLWRLFASPE